MASIIATALAILKQGQPLVEKNVFCAIHSS